MAEKRPPDTIGPSPSVLPLKRFKGYSDDDDADRSLLYCILLSKKNYIDLSSNDWYQKLTDIRKTYKMKHRSREKDVRALKSMIQKAGLLERDGNIVICHEECIDFMEDDVAYNCLTFNENYEKFLNVTPGKVLKKCVVHWTIIQENIMKSCDISNIVRNVGLDVFHFHNVRCKYKKKITKCLEILKLPFALFEMEEVVEEFQEYVQKKMKLGQKSLESLNLNSLFGSFLIRRQTGVYKALYNLAISQTKWNILVSILMSETYSLSLSTPWEGILTKLQSAFPSLRCRSKEIDRDIAELTDIYKVLNREKNSVRFISADIRHQVMSYFVEICLITDEDYENYIKMSSLDSLVEYVRPWWYVPYKFFIDEEKCLFLPESLENTLIQRFGLDILRHDMMLQRDDSDDDRTHKAIREKVKENLNIPEEVFDWEHEARCKYVECAKRGTKTEHTARAMILGCTGAGKTTLLKRLQAQRSEEVLMMKSTNGLEVEEVMFEITGGSRLKVLSESENKDDKQILSVMDFGGQFAYYACHQVYLSRRAFDLLVIDMSKPFTEKVDKTICEEPGTMFADWTYGEYVLFWLKSVHTYCDEETPIIVVATHSENVNKKAKHEFYGQLLDLLPTDSNLQKHLNQERCFFVEQLDDLSELQNCIVSLAKEKRWKESIPKEWSILELALMKMKSTEQVVSVKEIKNTLWLTKEEKIQDALCFFRDRGLILFFNEENLSDTIIIDIPWFVDTFKYIILDRSHILHLAENDKEWRDFINIGILKNNFLDRIFENLSIYEWQRPTILQYMQRLGLLVIGKAKHYVPCLNKGNLNRHERKALQEMVTKSSVLVFHFRFLPFFFFCRLIITCIEETEWEVQQDDGIDCVYKNIAVFMYKDHIIVLVLTSTAIQVQILRHQKLSIDVGVAAHIQETLQNRLQYLAITFHKKITFKIAFKCSDQDVFCDSVECYVYEEEIYKKGQILCPRHGLTRSHVINEETLTKFWNIGTSSVSCTKFGKVPLKNEEKLRWLVRLGRDALQVFLDSIFPSEDLQKLLKDNKEILCKGPFKFTASDVNIVYPDSESVGDSSSFSVPIMYKLLRNFGSNFPPPTNGWGKEPMIGEKTKGDDIERIRSYWNKLCHNYFNTQIIDDDFVCYWEVLKQAILRLSNGSLKSRIDGLDLISEATPKTYKVNTGQNQPLLKPDFKKRSLEHIVKLAKIERSDLQQITAWMNLETRPVHNSDYLLCEQIKDNQEFSICLFKKIEYLNCFNPLQKDCVSTNKHDRPDFQYSDISKVHLEKMYTKTSDCSHYLKQEMFYYALKGKPIGGNYNSNKLLRLAVEKQDLILLHILTYRGISLNKVDLHLHESSLHINHKLLSSTIALAIKKSLLEKIGIKKRDICDVELCLNMEDKDALVVCVVYKVYFAGDKEIDKINDLPIIWKSYKQVNEESYLVLQRERKLRSSPNNSNSFENTLPSVPSKTAHRLFNVHRNLTMIMASKFKSQGFKQGKHAIQQKTSITLLCKRKGLRPVGEPPFPTIIGDFHVDVLEGYSTFGDRCIQIGDEIQCERSDQNGQRIQKCGTVGGFVKLQNDRLGILTCAHVLYSLEDLEKAATSNGSLQADLPASVGHDRQCLGFVVKGCFSPNKEERKSIDAAVVEIDSSYTTDGKFSSSKTTINQILFAGYDLTSLPKFTGRFYPDKIPTSDIGNRVIKAGITTGLTCGSFYMSGSHVRLEFEYLKAKDYTSSNLMEREFKMYNQIAVLSDKNQLFFDVGDSGSFVFVRHPDKSLTCVGMAIGKTTNELCLVTPIQDILTSLDIQGLYCPLEEHMETEHISMEASPQSNQIDIMSYLHQMHQTMNKNNDNILSEIRSIKNDIKELKGASSRAKQE